VTRVKICGITEAEQALTGATAGADFLGLVFADSRRKVSLATATTIVDETAGPAVKPAWVGVFVNLPAEEVNRTADCCKLDYVQLSGQESWEYCRKIRQPIIKVIHIQMQSRAEEIISEIDMGYRRFKENLICLLDTGNKTVFGGTGEAFDWQIAKEVADRFPVIIAGGLNPANVKQLVNEVRPWGVDVSSGVETDGKKDIEKIRDFVHQAKSQ